MAMGGAAAQARSEPGPRYCAVHHCARPLVLLAVSKGSGFSLEAEVPLTFHHAASHLKPALTVTWSGAHAPL